MPYIVPHVSSVVIQLRLTRSIQQCHSTIMNIPNHFFMLVSHSGEYMANGFTNAIRHQFAMIAKVIARRSQVFVSIRGRSCGVVNIRNMFLKFDRKAYSYCFRNIFVSIAIILIDVKAFGVIVRHS